MGYTANKWSLWFEINCNNKSLWLAQFRKSIWFPFSMSSKCVCIQLYFVLLCSDLIAWVIFTFSSLLVIHRMFFHKHNEGHRMPFHKPSQHMNTMTPCLFSLSLMFSSILLGLCFLTFMSSKEVWRGKSQGKNSREKGKKKKQSHY